MELMELEGERYFCSTLMSGTTRIFCNHDRTSVGSCNMVKYQGELPSLYQNFRRIPGVPDREAGEVKNGLHSSKWANQSESPASLFAVWRQRGFGRLLPLRPRVFLEVIGQLIDERNKVHRPGQPTSRKRPWGQ